MYWVYVCIAVVSLGGDLIKRFLPYQIALVVIYAFSVFVIIKIISKFKKKPLEILLVNNYIRTFNFCLVLVISCYVFSFLISPVNIPLKAKITSLLYQCIPLIYCQIMLLYGHELKVDIEKLAFWFSLILIPFHLVGLLQYTVDPTFLAIDTPEYTSFRLRNGQFGVEGYKLLQSLFTSEGRYSSISLFQVYIAIMLFFKKTKKNRLDYLSITFNLIGGFSGMFFSAKRSSLILVILACSILIPFVLKALKNKTIHINFSKLVFSGFILIGILNVYLPSFLEAITSMPVLQMLHGTYESGDFWSRLNNTLQISFPPPDTLPFGEGLGINWVLGSQEFGIRAIWRSTGLIGGTLILLGFMGILLILGDLILLSIRKNNIFQIVTFIFPLLFILQGLLTGLTALYEISSGLLWWTTLGFMINSTSNI